MTKQEFEALSKGSISEDDYNEIEFIYTWYPTLSQLGTEAKAQIATIYNFGGMALIYDMHRRATIACDLANKLHTLDIQRAECSTELEDLKTVGLNRLEEIR